MKYTTFKLDKNPKQFKRLMLDQQEYSLRIEWNTRSKSWYVLAYRGNDPVLSLTKIKLDEIYYFDRINTVVPYSFTITCTTSVYDWDSDFMFILLEDLNAYPVNGFVNGGLIERSSSTSSNTHTKRILSSNENSYLFDIEDITE